MCRVRLFVSKKTTEILGLFSTLPQSGEELLRFDVMRVLSDDVPAERERMRLERAVSHHPSGQCLHVIHADHHARKGLRSAGHSGFKLQDVILGRPTFSTPTDISEKANEFGTVVYCCGKRVPDIREHFLRVRIATNDYQSTLRFQAGAVVSGFRQRL